MVVNLLLGWHHVVHCPNKGWGLMEPKTRLSVDKLSPQSIIIIISP